MGTVIAVDSVIDLPGLKVGWKDLDRLDEKKSILRAILCIRNENLFHHFDDRKKLKGVLKAMA